MIKKSLVLLLALARLLCNQNMQTACVGLHHMYLIYRKWSVLHRSLSHMSLCEHYAYNIMNFHLSNRPIIAVACEICPLMSIILLWCRVEQFSKKQQAWSNPTSTPQCHDHVDYLVGNYSMEDSHCYLRFYSHCYRALVICDKNSH